jgi:hypothetical protein
LKQSPNRKDHLGGDAPGELPRWLFKMIIKDAVLVDDVKITFLKYPFPTFDPFIPFIIYEQMALHSVREIAATKAYTEQKRRSPVHHSPTTSQVPAATKPAPAIREIRRPTGTIFSMSTKAEIVAIHSTFITPPTNKSAINTQQQPTQ